MKATALVTILFLSMITTVSAAESPLEQRRKALDALLGEQWQYVLSTNPEFGQLKILELREKSKKALGSKFDIREFHDEVLGAGALPMNILEQRIDRWIAAKKKG